MVPYSKEMRRGGLAAYDRGEGTRAVALSFNCSEFLGPPRQAERRELGKIAPLLTRRRMPKWEIHREQIVELIAQHPDMTLQELKDELKTPLSRADALHGARKTEAGAEKSLKGRRTRPSRRLPNVRASWRAMQAGLAPERLVFIDETWAKTNMTPAARFAALGWSAAVPHGIGKRPRVSPRPLADQWGSPLLW